RLAALSCFLSSRRRHTRSKRDWSSDVCSSDLSFSDNQHGGSLPRRCERSILIGIVGLQARQSNSPRSSSAGGARLSGNALVPLEIGRASCREGGRVGGDGGTIRRDRDGRSAAM